MKWLLLMLAVCQTDDVSEARQRLRDLEARRAEAAQVQAAVEKKAAEELAAKLEAEQAAMKAAEEEAARQEEVVPVVEQKPLRLEPTISFERVVAAKIDERRPRLIDLNAVWCSPCRQMKDENPGLFGGPDSPIEMLDIESPEFRAVMDGYGLTGWSPKSIPVLFCVQRDGTLLRGKNNTFTMWSGYRTPAQLQAIMTECGVSVETVQSNDRVVATVENLEATPDGLAGVLAAHLIEQASAEVEPDRALYGSLFEFDVDVPDRTKELLAKILTQRTIEFPKAGVTVEWGAKRVVTFSEGRIDITPSVKVRVKRSVFSYTAGLQGISYADDLSSVVVELSGAPDLEVRLK
jgi:hypothetical protein